MTTSHQNHIFAQALAEHQHIRMLLGQIEGLFGHLEEKRAGQPSSGQLDALQTLCGIRGLLVELRRSLALEGGNGEVAISLACDRSLDAQVSAATTRREVLELQIGQLAEDKVDVHTESQVAEMTDLFPRVADGLKEYLSVRMDLLRKSLPRGRTEKASKESVLLSESAERILE
jgi:hypothetical protein